MHSIIKFSANKWPLLIVLFFAGLALSYKIDKPFWGHHDWNGVYWGNVARNYSRYGFANTKLAMVETIGPSQVDHLSYTFHYSPLFPITQSIFLSILGTKEWVYRLVSVIFSLATLGVFYQLIKKFYHPTVALNTLFFWIATPMFLYFGKMPVHEPMVLFFSVLTIYLYLMNQPKKALFSIVLAELTSWPGYFLVPAISLHWLLWDRGKHVARRRILIWFWAVSLIVFLSLMIHDLLITGSLVGGGLVDIFFFRLRSVALISYVSELFRWGITYYTFLLPMSFAFILLAFFRKIQRLDIPFLFLIFALIYPIIFRDASFRHDYLLIYFLPFLTLSSSLLIDSLLKNKIAVSIVVLIISFTMLVMRWNFLLALENSDIYRQSVRFGKYINDHSQLNDKILAVTADSSIGWDSWFLGYYADRKISQSNYFSPSSRGNYDKVFIYLPGGKIISQ